jgi:hypothetical protein
MEDAQRHMDNLKKDVPVLMGYVDIQKNFAKKHNCIYTAFGRKIPIKDINHPNRVIRSKSERCAINYTIQSTSADVLKYAMCWVEKQLKAHNWKDICKYVLTVHDEVVYEVKPEYLMEVVRKLDEWMTYPWKIPKQHGPEWKVPLLTEPGIGTHWRVPYDYFKMVDGVPAKPKDIAPGGTYTGKLKKDEYFLNGKVYQKIPDFLKDYLHRLDPTELKEVSTPPIIEPKIEEVPKKESKPPKVEESISQEKDSPSLELEVGNLSDSNSDSNSIENPPKGVEMDLNIEDTPIEIIQTKPKSPKPKEIFAWTMRVVPSEYVMKKMHAIIILSEGSTHVLRILNNKGDVLISEKEELAINSDLFVMLTNLFGV